MGHSYSSTMFVEFGLGTYHLGREPVAARVVVQEVKATLRSSPMTNDSMNTTEHRNLDDFWSMPLRGCLTIRTTAT
jgi:hypothetical protein